MGMSEPFKKKKKREKEILNGNARHDDEKRGKFLRVWGYSKVRYYYYEAQGGIELFLSSPGWSYVFCTLCNKTAKKKEYIKRVQKKKTNKNRKNLQRMKKRFLLIYRGFQRKSFASKLKEKRAKDKDYVTQVKKIIIFPRKFWYLYYIYIKRKNKMDI